MAVLPTHNLIWLKPHAGKAAGQPLSFKEKTQLSRLRRMAFKGMVGKAEDHPEIVKKFEKAKKDAIKEAIKEVTKVVIPAEPETEEVETPAEPETEEVETPAEPETEEVETPAEPETEEVETPAEEAKSKRKSRKRRG